MRDENCIKLNYKELSEKCANISITCSKLQAKNVEEEKRGQTQSKFWHSFRVGRITASRAKAVVSTNKASPSQSLVKDICYPEDRKVEIPATKWGCDHEQDAIRKFMEEIGPLHENSRLQNSGFVISQDFPYIGMSPDAIFICDCCGPACVEVKCPYNSRFEEISENTIPFLHRQNNELELKHDHQYYYQVQTQLGVSRHEVGYFVVWTENSLHVEAVMFDNPLWDKICASAKEIMYSSVLQELVGKFFTRMPVTTNVLQSIENSTYGNSQLTKNGASDQIQSSSDMKENEETLYCFCNQVEHGKMIGCDNEACEIEWFHYRCVNVEIAPKGKWFCPDCRKLPNFKRRR